MKIQLKILLSFFALFVACSMGQKRGQARELLARLRRSAERASEVLDRLQSEGACDKTTGSHDRDEARKARVPADCPDWLIDYFRNQRAKTIGRR